LRVVSVATYTNPAIPYRSPYSFAKAPPKSETTGPLYRNTFTYFSTPLPVPSLTPELKERLVASVQDSLRDANGALPAEGTKEYRTLQRELELARDDRLTGGETSVFLTREWLRDRGAPLQREVDRAHEFVAKYLVLDINRTAVPSLTGTDELLETGAEDRTVRRIGSGVEAGSYVSSAANVTSPASLWQHRRGRRGDPGLCARPEKPEALRCRRSLSSQLWAVAGGCRDAPRRSRRPTPRSATRCGSAIGIGRTPMGAIRCWSLCRPIRR
jgi:hypothetical protein